MKSNFDFLNRYWPALAQIGATAETYVYSDPNACIYKLGMFAERLVQETHFDGRQSVHDVELIDDLCDLRKSFQFATSR